MFMSTFTAGFRCAMISRVLQQAFPRHARRHRKTLRQSNRRFLRALGIFEILSRLASTASPFSRLVSELVSAFGIGLLKALYGIAVFRQRAARATMTFIGKDVPLTSGIFTSSCSAETQRLIDVGIRQHGGIDGSRGKRDNPRRRIAGGKNRYRLARYIPCFEKREKWRFRWRRRPQNADLLAGQILRLTNLFLGHEAVRKIVERPGNR